MTHVPVTISADTTLPAARATMSRYGIRHLPVVEGGRPVGMVADRDLLIAETIFAETAMTPATHVVRLLGAAAVHAVRVDTTLDAVLAQMHRERLDAVVVVDREGRIVGIFTATDACGLRPHYGL